MSDQQSDGKLISPDQQENHRNLEESQIKMINEALAALGDFGEVRLVVEKGRLRFVVIQNSHDVYKYSSGDFSLNK